MRGSFRAVAPPSFDLISTLAHREDTRTRNENTGRFLGNLLLSIVGANDTARNSISGDIVKLNDHPDEYYKLLEGLALIPSTLSEMSLLSCSVIRL